MADSRDKPELETLSYKPANIIGSDADGVNLEQTKYKSPKCALPDENGGVLANPIMSKEEAEKTAREYFKTTEQPNQNLMIIEEIEGLISQVNEKIERIEAPITTNNTINEKLRLQSLAFEEINLFETTTLFDLRKAFE